MKTPIRYPSGHFLMMVEKLRTNNIADNQTVGKRLRGGKTLVEIEIYVYKYLGTLYLPTSYNIYILPTS